MPLPPDVKHTIAAKLHDGVRIESILNSIQDSMLDDTIGRRQLLSRQIILNIKNKLNIRSIMKHSNDHFSTSAWVEELQSQPQNPVLLYKPQGVVQSDETDNLGTNDFLLVLQTPSQRDVLKQYGGKAILMDATHSTTQYDFLLITIMVLEDYGEGVKRLQLTQMLCR